MAGAHELTHGAMSESVPEAVKSPLCDPQRSICSALGSERANVKKERQALPAASVA